RKARVMRLRAYATGPPKGAAAPERLSALRSLALSGEGKAASLGGFCLARTRTYASCSGSCLRDREWRTDECSIPCAAIFIVREEGLPVGRPCGARRRPLAGCSTGTSWTVKRLLQRADGLAMRLIEDAKELSELKRHLPQVLHGTEYDWSDVSE